MKLHELLFTLALEAQRFDLDLPPEALPIVDFGLRGVQAAKTRDQFLAAMSAIPELAKKGMS